MTSNLTLKSLGYKKARAKNGLEKNGTKVVIRPRVAVTNYLAIYNIRFLRSILCGIAVLYHWT